MLVNSLLVLLSLGAAETVAGPVRAEDHPPASWEERLALKRLTTTAVVLHVTAHPDDEDGPLLTALSRGIGARTLLFVMNRGEGGANLISEHLQDRLAVLRTLELMAACRYYGAEPYFNRLADYGYSKRLEEALEKWGGENVILEDLVRVIRRERPHVLMARFRADARDGGGHATAHLVGLMARRAFEVAGDPRWFPGQIAAGLKPWQPRKLYVHSRRPDQGMTLGPATVVVDAGAFAPELGRSYLEISRLGLRQHRTQGMADRMARPGPFPIHYERLAAHAGFSGVERDILEGVRHRPADLSPALAEIDRLADQALSAADSGQRVRLVAEGLSRLRLVLASPERLELNTRETEEVLFRLRQEESEFEAALVALSGITAGWWVEPPAFGEEPFPPWRAEETFDHAVAGQAFRVRFQLTRSSQAPVEVVETGLQAPDGWTIRRRWLSNVEPAIGATTRAGYDVEVAADALPTRPHWRRPSTTETVHEIRDPALAGRPLPPFPLTGWARVRLEGVEATLRGPVRLTRLDPDRSVRHPPLTVAPMLSVSFQSPAGVHPLGSDRYPVAVAVRNHGTQSVEGRLELQLPEGWRGPAPVDFGLREGSEQVFDLRVEPPPGLAQGRYRLAATASAGGRRYSDGFETITAPGPGRFPYLEPAVHRISALRVSVADGLRIGYIEGSGDRVAEAIERLGAAVEVLDDADLASGPLDFDAIVVGVRAYAVRPALHANTTRLLDFASAGGVVIVQYQTPEFDAGVAPYPVRMGFSPEEVSEEDSAVRLLEPDQVLLSRPNRIGPADFEGWASERGSKFLSSWDPRYVALLETADAGQSPQRGGLLYVRYGEGAWVYCAYSLYRQLPEAVPGAFRLLANLISLSGTMGAEP